MGVFDSLSGDQNRDGDNVNDVDPDDIDQDDDDSDDDSNDSDGKDQDGNDDKSKRRRNRPGTQRRDRDRIRGLESRLDQLMGLIEKGGLAVNAPKDGDKKEVDVNAIRQEIEAEIAAKSNAGLIRAEARSALKDAGFRGNASRGVSMLRLRSIEVVDGEVDEDALIDAIEDLKEDSPELFGRVRRTSGNRSRGNYDDLDDDAGNGRQSRESRPARSRERMSRDSVGGSDESDSLADNLLKAIGGQRSRQ